jgi:phage terminase large subunit-like protein
MVDITAQALLAMPEGEMHAILNTWSSNKVGLHDVDWHFWRRDAQKPPAGDWRVWLVMAGWGRNG